jgi:hypothetical protein
MRRYHRSSKQGRERRKPNWIGRRASASAGRRAGEESGVPVSNGWAIFASRGVRAHLNQNDEGSGNCGRGHGMENDAEGAVVGVSFKRMSVRNLNDRQQSQQDEAQDRRRRDHAGFGEWSGEKGLAPG